MLGPWDPGMVGRASGHQVEQGLPLAPPCRLRSAMRITVSVSSPLTWAKASLPGEQECSEQPPRQGDGAHEGCPCYGVWGVRGPSLISLGLSAPQLACRPPSSNPQDPGDAGKAALSSWKARPRV